MKRILLFIVTNLAIVFVLSIVLHLLGVDRILDMCRTAINVSGDLVAAKLMDRWVGSSSSLGEERAEEARRENIRRQTGEDVISSGNNSDRKS